jgi:hypothetical protein
MHVRSLEKTKRQRTHGKGKKNAQLGLREAEIIQGHKYRQTIDMHASCTWKNHVVNDQRWSNDMAGRTPGDDAI